LKAAISEVQRSSLRRASTRAAGRRADLVGAGEEVRLVRFQKGEDRGQSRRLAEARAKLLGREAGQREEALGAAVVAQGPAQGGERERGGIPFVCFLNLHRLRVIRGALEASRVGQKILVVEDNELNLKLFCDLLRAHGYEAEPVRDGREAVERARSFGPELVIMDIQMPYVTGLELIEQMKADEELRRTPIMAVTAYAAKGDEERIREAGAEGYVSKPISLMRFIEAVRGLLAAAEAEAEGAEAGPAEEEQSAPDAQTRYSRESGNPDEASNRPAAAEGALDPRFRGDDGQGQDASDRSEGADADEASAANPDAAHVETADAAAPEGEAEPAAEDVAAPPGEAPDGDTPEAPPETVIPAEAGISGREDAGADGERPGSAAEPPQPFTP
jgi:two-component system cell cycle response regulator DivK